MNLPCVRFIRGFDVTALRMVNLWMNITTQEQLNNPPMALEITVTAQNVEDAMIKIREFSQRGFLDESTIDEIGKASKLLVDACASVYKAL